MKKHLGIVLAAFLLSSSALADGVFVPPTSVGTSLPGQIAATATNDSAATGKLGELVSSQITRASAVTLANATGKSITSISLTAGDWEVSGTIGLTGSTAVGTAFIGGISTTLDQYGAGETARFYMPTANISVDDMQLPTVTIPLSFSATTTVYLNVGLGFATGTAKAYGTINARRVR